ncbi:hypothetical protein F2Q69_00006077 [Brassica cretica]|uniref:Uncharacterized protein n=1 Tax=Brassica cretica TaxID=69181 RepID=A0A8S9PHV0_BRACR|nr:hypothetical protein F2Q69_00006077 [Brassica cretica]
MPKIDIARINALRPQPKLANPPETTSTHSEDAPEPMQVDKATMGRTLRKRKEKVAKHLKRGANEKEMESFLKRVLRIPLEKPFEEAYFTYRLLMFFRETKETEEDIRRMFHQSLFRVITVPGTIWREMMYVELFGDILSFAGRKRWYGRNSISTDRYHRISIDVGILTAIDYEGIREFMTN